MHPLGPSLANLSDDELHKKRADLQNKMNFAYRTGNAGLVGQIQMLLDDYLQEIQVRNQKMMEQMMAQTDKAYKDSIDISK